MPLDGILKDKLHLILSLFNIIMELPITETELDHIIEMIKLKYPQLYNKLWSYRFRIKYQQEKT
jgi:hypothetical protein